MADTAEAARAGGRLTRLFWSAADDAELTRFWLAGLAVRGIADRMERSWDAVRARAQRLGLYTDDAGMRRAAVLPPDRPLQAYTPPALGCVRR